MKNTCEKCALKLNKKETNWEETVPNKNKNNKMFKVKEHTFVVLRNNLFHNCSFVQMFII